MLQNLVQQKQLKEKDALFGYAKRICRGFIEGVGFKPNQDSLMKSIWRDYENAKVYFPQAPELTHGMMRAALAAVFDPYFKKYQDENKAQIDKAASSFGDALAKGKNRKGGKGKFRNNMYQHPRRRRR